MMAMISKLFSQDDPFATFAALFIMANIGISAAIASLMLANGALKAASWAAGIAKMAAWALKKRQPARAR